MVKRRLIVVAVIAFFFGFPLAGMGYFYYLAHDAMRDSAVEFADIAVDEILSTNDYESLHHYATLALRKKIDEQAFVSDVSARGAYKGHGDIQAVRSTVGARNDQAWQFVYLKIPVRFERGTAQLSLTAARRSTDLGDWRIEEFSIKP